MTFTAALASIGAGLSAATAGTAAAGLGSAVGGGLAAGTLGNAIGAGALMGSTLGGITSAATGQDVGEGMGMGALTGAVGGGLTSGLGSLAGEGAQAAAQAENAAVNAGAGYTADSGVNIGANTAAAANPSGGITDLATGPQTYAAPYNPQPFTQTPIDVAGNAIGSTTNINPVTGAPAQASETIGNKIGDFALKHPVITSAVGSMGANAALSPMFEDNTQKAPGMQYPNIDPNKFKYSQPKWSIYQPTYMASGGITDLDAGSGMPSVQLMARGGVSDLGGYSDGGVADLGGYRSGGSPNLLRDTLPSSKNDGVSDGVSDDIKATIAGKQPARLADGEYVVSSRIVSELGNGSTDAGAARLDQMVKRIQAGRQKTIGTNKEFAKDTKAYKHLPA